MLELVQQRTLRRLVRVANYDCKSGRRHGARGEACSGDRSANGLPSMAACRQPPLCATLTCSRRQVLRESASNVCSSSARRQGFLGSITGGPPGCAAPALGPLRPFTPCALPAPGNRAGSPHPPNRCPVGEFDPAPAEPVCGSLKVRQWSGLVLVRIASSIARAWHMLQTWTASGNATKQAQTADRCGSEAGAGLSATMT